MVAHWLLILGDHDLILEGEKNFPLSFWVAITWLLFNNKLIHDYAEWSVNGLIPHVWLPIRLKNLIARYKAFYNKKSYRGGR